MKRLIEAAGGQIEVSQSFAAKFYSEHPNADMIIWVTRSPRETLASIYHSAMSAPTLEEDKIYKQLTFPEFLTLILPGEIMKRYACPGEAPVHMLEQWAGHFTGWFHFSQIHKNMIVVPIERILSDPESISRLLAMMELKENEMVVRPPPYLLENHWPKFANVDDEAVTLMSYNMYWNLMNEAEFWFDQVI